MFSRLASLAKTPSVSSLSNQLLHQHASALSRASHSKIENQDSSQSLSVPLDKYCDLLKKTLTGYTYPEAGALPVFRGQVPDARPIPFDAYKRWYGYDWPVVGHTMVGVERLSSLQHILVDLTRDVEGDFLEAGVWRGVFAFER